MLTLGLVTIVAGIAGVMLDGLVPALWFGVGGIGPVLLLAAVASWRYRRVLRSSQAEVLAAPGDSFRALALPLVPALFALVVVAKLAPFLLPQGWPGAAPLALGPTGDVMAIVFSLLIGSLAHAAGLAVCVATLTGRRSWPASLVEIGWRYFVFRLLLFGSFIALGVMNGLILSFAKQLLNAFLGWQLPVAWAELFDRLVDGGFASLIFLGLVGGAWVAAEQCFPRLLRTGDVHFLRAMAGLYGDQDEPPKETADPTWPGVTSEGLAATPPPPPAG